jgi:hypothetical protein
MFGLFRGMRIINVYPKSSTNFQFVNEIVANFNIYVASRMLALQWEVTN